MLRKHNRFNFNYHVPQARREWAAEKARAVQLAVSSAREEWRGRLEEESRASVRHALTQARMEGKREGGEDDRRTEDYRQELSRVCTLCVW